MYEKIIATKLSFGVTVTYKRKKKKSTSNTETDLL